MSNWSDESGDWRGLANDGERPRYQAIGSQVRELASSSVLDIGCGEALLSAYMPATVTRYLGVEPSAVAVEGARSRQVDVVHGTAEEYEADSVWDCIVFNEVLYYTADPVGVLRKYARVLAPNGTIIVSIYQRPGQPSWKRRLKHWMDHKRPMSNVHCTQMVTQFFKDERWDIRHAEHIQSSPRGAACWQLLVVHRP